MRHIKALDGLRGMAIMMVILLHYTWLSCGWAGVQIFFVLSGYLISSILLSDRQLPLPVYLKKFYWRRSLRIFPLYYAYVIGLAAAYLLTGKPAGVGQHWPYLLTYTLNYCKVSPAFVPSTLYGHLWSLAIEEQFYLAWPLLLYFLPSRWIPRVLVTMLLVCPVLRGYSAIFLGSMTSDRVFIGQAVYNLTFCQADAFAAGALVAVFQQELRTHALALFLSMSVLLLAAGQVFLFLMNGKITSFGYDLNLIHYGQHIWGYTLINLWAASLLLLLCQPNWLSRLFANPALAYIGKISYGMYVFHLLVMVFVLRIAGKQHSLLNLATFLAYIVLLVLVCAASYHFFESRFLALKGPAKTKAPGSDLDQAAAAVACGV